MWQTHMMYLLVPLIDFILGFINTCTDGCYTLIVDKLSMNTDTKTQCIKIWP